MRELEKLRKEMKLNFKSLEELKCLEIENFNEHPDLKRRIKIHLSNKRQNEAVFDDKNLVKEFNLLKVNNELNLLFEEEEGC